MHFSIYASVVLSSRIRLDPTATTRLLLVEDDDADALIVEELLADSGNDFELLRARSVAEALAGPFSGIDCMLLDLGLPDAMGISALDAVLVHSPDLVVVVLTGLLGEAQGIEAVSAGAEDYLIKGRVDGHSLARAIRYATERRAIGETRRRMLSAERAQRENARMARGLLPFPIVQDPQLQVVTRYQPGGPDAQLGGDFFDLIETPDGTIRAVIGDVCGHGPDEAALGVAMRIAWRALVRAGLSPNDVVLALDDVFMLERRDEFLFTTICDLEIAKDRRSMTVRLCGHPSPLLIKPEIRWLEEIHTNPPVGIFEPGAEIISTTIDLPAEWSLILLTDGIYEGKGDDGRLGMDRLTELAAKFGADGASNSLLLDRLIAAAQEANGAGLPDDVALMAIEVLPTS